MELRFSYRIPIFFSLSHPAGLKPTLRVRRGGGGGGGRHEDGVLLDDHGGAGEGEVVDSVEEILVQCVAVPPLLHTRVHQRRPVYITEALLEGLGKPFHSLTVVKNYISLS